MLRGYDTKGAQGSILSPSKNILCSTYTRTNNPLHPFDCQVKVRAKLPPFPFEK